jgi:hypothetical protein
VRRRRFSLKIKQTLLARICNANAIKREVVKLKKYSLM